MNRRHTVESHGFTWSSSEPIPEHIREHFERCARGARNRHPDAPAGVDVSHLGELPGGAVAAWEDEWQASGGRSRRTETTFEPESGEPSKTWSPGLFVGRLVLAGGVGFAGIFVGFYAFYSNTLARIPYELGFRDPQQFGGLLGLIFGAVLGWYLPDFFGSRNRASGVSLPGPIARALQLARGAGPVRAVLLFILFSFFFLPLGASLAAEVGLLLGLGASFICARLAHNLIGNTWVLSVAVRMVARYWLLGALVALGLATVYALNTGGAFLPAFLALLAVASVGAVAWVLIGLYANLWEGLEPQGTWREALRGRGQIHYDDAKKITDQAVRRSVPGVYFGGLTVPHYLNTEHFLFIGTSGSGKSINLELLMRSAIRTIGKRDYPSQRALIIASERELKPLLAHWLTRDPKGPQHATAPLYCLDPFDPDGFYWDIAQDTLSDADAMALARALLLEAQATSDKIWGAGPQAIATGVIQALAQRRRDHGVSWNFRDLLLALSDLEDMEALIRQLPSVKATKLLTAERTSMSFLVTNIAFLAPFFTVAALWDERQRAGGPGVSLFRGPDGKREGSWLASESVLLLCDDIDYKASVRPLNRLILELVGGKAGSGAEVVASEAATPTTWVFVDELVELGKMGGITDILRAGRKRGLAVAAAFQNISGLRHEYGMELSKDLIGLFSNKAVLRSDGAAAELHSEIFGTNEALDHTQGRTAEGDSTAGESFGRTPIVDAGEIRDLPHLTSSGKISGFFSTPLPEMGPYQLTYLRSFLEKNLFQAKNSVRHLAPQRIDEVKAQAFSDWTDEERAAFGLPPAKDEDRSTRSAAGAKTSSARPSTEEEPASDSEPHAARPSAGGLFDGIE